MRKLALILAAVSTLALSVPAFVNGASAAGARLHLARADVTVIKTVRPRTVAKRVVVKRHHVWHPRRHPVSHTVVVKKRANGTVVRRVITRR